MGIAVYRGEASLLLLSSLVVGQLSLALFEGRTRYSSNRQNRLWTKADSVTYFSNFSVSGK
jgi:hypothetical protein